MRLVHVLFSRPLTAGIDGGTGAGLDLGGSVAFPWVPLLLLAVPALVAVGLIWMYFRTARRMRQAQLAPPVWLLPYLEQQSEEPPKVWPPTQSSADIAADLAERADSVGRLARRKRAILLGLALNFVAGWAAAGAYLYESKRGGEYQELPSTSSLASSLDTMSFAGLEEGGDLREEGVDGPTALPGQARPDSLPADTAAVRLRNEQRLAFFRRRDSLAEVARADSIALAEQAAIRIRDSIAELVRDSIARAAALRPPVVVPTPAPPPPPPPAPPPPDPAVELAQARDVLTAGARSLVGGMGSSQVVSESVVPGSVRQQFAAFLAENRPTVALASLEEPVLRDGQASAVLVVQFQWRGSFGDTRRRSVRFRAEASRGNTGWRLVSFTALDDPP